MRPTWACPGVYLVSSLPWTQSLRVCDLSFWRKAFFPEVRNWCPAPPVLTGLLTEESRKVCISGQTPWLQAPPFRPLPPSEDEEESSFYPRCSVGILPCSLKWGFCSGSMEWPCGEPETCAKWSTFGSWGVCVCVSGKGLNPCEGQFSGVSTPQAALNVGLSFANKGLCLRFSVLRP